MRKSGYLVRNDSDNKTENVKRRHDEANQGSGDRKGPCKTCQFKRKSTEGGSHCVTDCRQVMTVLHSLASQSLLGFRGAFPEVRGWGRTHSLLGPGIFRERHRVTCLPTSARDQLFS